MATKPIYKVATTTIVPSTAAPVAVTRAGSKSFQIGAGFVATGGGALLAGGAPVLLPIVEENEAGYEISSQLAKLSVVGLDELENYRQEQQNSRTECTVGAAMAEIAKAFVETAIDTLDQREWPMVEDLAETLSNQANKVALEGGVGGNELKEFAQSENGFKLEAAAKQLTQEEAAVLLRALQKRWEQTNGFCEATKEETIEEPERQWLKEVGCRPTLLVKGTEEKQNSWSFVAFNQLWPAQEEAEEIKSWSEYLPTCTVAIEAGGWGTYFASWFSTPTPAIQQ